AVRSRYPGSSTSRSLESPAKPQTTGTLRKGRGWFRTRDLSRVNWWSWYVAGRPETALPSGMRGDERRRPCEADYGGLRTITGDSGRRGGFLHNGQRAGVTASPSHGNGLGVDSR